VGDTVLEDPVGFVAGDVHSVDGDGAALGFDHAADGAQEGGFAGAVGAEDRDDFPGVDLQVDTVEGFDGTVSGDEVLDGQ
jgi:hypothetical protein